MDLRDLLQQAQRLNNRTKMDAELPRVERTISQVLQATQELHSRVTQTGTNDLQAYTLLGSKGVDLPKLTQKLESLSARRSFEPLDPVTDSDVKGYLKNERENAILSVIDETNRSIFDSVERSKWRCIYAEWGREKERLLNSLVGPKQEDFPDVLRQTVSSVLQENPTPKSLLTNIELLYALEITTYNHTHLSAVGHRPNLIAKFTKLAREKFPDEFVHEMWSVLEFMAGVTPLTRNVDPIKNRQTTPQFVQQARTYLERRYRHYMNTVIKQNLAIAQRGGVPNIFNMVSSFVGVTFRGPQTLVGLLDVNNSRPLWPLVYYSLRSGDLSAAVQFLKESGACPELLKYMILLQESDEAEKSNSKLVGQLKLEYNNKLRLCSDPFKKAVYAIILACDPHDSHAEIMHSIDDFLWMQLSILRTDDRRDYNVEQLTYSGLQSMILDKYGENYFNAREKTELYFQVLALTGQFESAIEFLARTEANRPHAVHMAIALHELCLLGVPNSGVQQPLLCVEPEDPKPMKRLNLARLIIMYAKCFEQTDPNEAMQYYYLLRHFKSSDGKNLMLTCMCDLLIENCDEQMLQLVFGVQDTTESWRYSGGIFSQFPALDFDKYFLAGMVGDELANRSNFESAIKFYFIAGHLDKTLRLISSLLAQVVHQRTREGSLRHRLVAIIERMNNALAVRKIDVDAQAVVTYQLLAQLLQFFDYYHENEARLALEILVDYRLTPTSCANVDECVKNLKRMGPEIIKVLPDVLLAAMNIIYSEYQSLRSGSASPNNNTTLTIIDDSGLGKEAALCHLRDRAKALTNMAATVPYRMPADTNKRLVQIEILMH
ncbi:nuclear pore complex protein Nup93-1 [Drosophila tropicalis]|uniref:nuclear pore complex protein Nup93-1 n=1 Tax=Drosophila tropicalis TaxID=46794 RepID=UPI0035ABC9BC